MWGRKAVDASDYIRQPTQYVDGAMMRDLIHSWMGPPKERAQ